MSEYAIMIDNEYCTGCHSCELACRNERNLSLGEWGIKVLELGPYRRGKSSWEHRYVPVLTSDCDLCVERTGRGEQPSCVLHCLASVMEYGTLDELAQKMRSKQRMAMILIP